VADHYDSASGLTLTASRVDLLKTLALSAAGEYWIWPVFRALAHFMGSGYRL
jgi:hypothetical protein